ADGTMRRRRQSPANSIMSQTTPPDRASAPTDRGPKPSRPRGRWRRRILYTLATLAVLAIVLRIALIFILPAVLRNVADTYGLAMTYDRYSLSVLGGNMYLWRLSLAPQAAPDRRVAYVEYIDGDISTWHLLRGKLVVYRAEADGVDLLIERMSDGTIPLLESLLA